MRPGRAKVAKYSPRGIADYIAGKRFFSESDIDALIADAGGLPTGQVVIDAIDADESRFVRRRLSRRKALGHRLELAAHHYNIDVAFQAAPTPSTMALRMRAIAAAADALLSALTLNQPRPRNVPEPIAQRLRAQAQKYAERRRGFPQAFPDAAPFPWGMPGDDKEYIDYLPATALRRAAWAVWYLKVWAKRAEYRERSFVARNRHRTRHTGDKAFRLLIEALANIWLDVFKRLPRSSVDPQNGRPGGPFVRFVLAVCQRIGTQRSEGAIRAAIRKLRRPSKSDRDEI